MHFAPAQWLIQLIALLPVALRPGVFLAVVISFLWFLFVLRGLPALWRRVCRGLAITVDILVGAALFPEYVITTTNRNRGRSPGAVTLAIATIAENVLDFATAFYERNLPKTPKTQEAPKPGSGPAKPSAGAAPKKQSRKRFPWLWCGLVIAACAGAWVAMDQMAPAEESKRTFAEVFEYWRSVEAWANVDPSRRAAPGDTATPVLLSVSYHPAYAHIALRCTEGIPCRGLITVRTESGAVTASRSVELEPGSDDVISAVLAGRPTKGNRHLHVDVTQP